MLELDLRATLIDDPDDLKREAEWEGGLFHTFAPVPGEALDEELKKHEKRTRRGKEVKVSDHAEMAFWTKRVLGLRGLKDTSTGNEIRAGVRRASTEEECDKHSVGMSAWIEDYDDPGLVAFGKLLQVKGQSPSEIGRITFPKLKERLWKKMAIVYRGWIREECQELESFRGEADGAAAVPVVDGKPAAAGDVPD